MSKSDAKKVKEKKTFLVKFRLPDDGEELPVEKTTFVVSGDTGNLFPKLHEIELLVPVTSVTLSRLSGCHKAKFVTLNLRNWFQTFETTTTLWPNVHTFRWKCKWNMYLWVEPMTYMYDFLCTYLYLDIICCLCAYLSMPVWRLYVGFYDPSYLTLPYLTWNFQILYISIVLCSSYILLIISLLYIFCM